MDKILAITGATGKSGGSFIGVLKQNNEQVANCFGRGRFLVRHALDILREVLKKVLLVKYPNF